MYTIFNIVLSRHWFVWIVYMCKIYIHMSKILIAYLIRVEIIAFHSNMNCSNIITNNNFNCISCCCRKLQVKMYTYSNIPVLITSVAALHFISIFTYAMLKFSAFFHDIIGWQVECCSFAFAGFFLSLLPHYILKSV